MGKVYGGGGGGGDNGEDLNRLLRDLKLTEEEERGVKGEWSAYEGEQGQIPQAVGKLFSSRPGYVDGMVRTLGKIWCPLKGIRCKELGDNLFLFSFLQPGGKRRAIMEGPWEFGGDLLIVVDFDKSKRLKDLDFNYVSIWIRIYDLPFGMMNAATGKAIGDKLGKMLEVDAEEDGSAVGSYLRVKVQVDIQKPLQRGVTLEHDDKGNRGWCPIRYEFLPNFCYECGMLGHVDKECDKNIGKQDVKQFGDWLRASPARRRGVGEYRTRGVEGGTSGSERLLRNSDSWGTNSAKTSTQQNISSRRESLKIGDDLRDDETIPLKVHMNESISGEPQKLSVEAVGDQEGNNNKGNEKEEEVMEKEKEAMEKEEEGSTKDKQSALVGELNDGEKEKEMDGSMLYQPEAFGEVMDLDTDSIERGTNERNLENHHTSIYAGKDESGLYAMGSQENFQKEKQNLEMKGGKTFTRLPRTLKEDGDAHANQISKKRTLEEEGTEDETKKKRKEGTTFEIMDMEEFNLTAGLQERLRRDQ
jgi:hypothetical protein